MIDGLTREAALVPDLAADGLIAELVERIPPLTRFGTAIDVTVAELRMEAFLPADEPTARALRGLDGTMLQRVET